MNSIDNFLLVQQPRLAWLLPTGYSNLMERLSDALSALLASMDDSRRQAELHRLWRSWSEAVGEHLAMIARPLGTRRDDLVVGVEDSMLMQDMVHYGPALVEQANAFLGRKVFDKVRVELIGGRVPLDADLGPVLDGDRYEPPLPNDVGELADRLPQDSAIGRCYREYVRLVRDAGRNNR